MNARLIIYSFLLFFSTNIYSADIVPYSIKSVKAVGHDFVELIGPGKIEVNGETIPYEGTKYIRSKNIDTLSSVTGSSKGCLLSYSTEGYTENISVTNQSCNEILKIISN